MDRFNEHNYIDRVPRISQPRICRPKVRAELGELSDAEISTTSAAFPTSWKLLIHSTPLDHIAIINTISSTPSYTSHTILQHHGSPNRNRNNHTDHARAQSPAVNPGSLGRDTQGQNADACHAKVRIQAGGARISQGPTGCCIPHFRKIRIRRGYVASHFISLSRHSYPAGVAGHITLRDPVDPTTFWVNPFGRAFSLMKKSDLIQVDHHGKVIDGGPNRMLNAAAFMIHSAIHAARPDVLCAAHSHSLHGRAFCSLGRPLDIISQDSCAFYNVSSSVIACFTNRQYSIHN